jgi:hypothetical protein
MNFQTVILMLLLPYSKAFLQVPTNIKLSIETFNTSRCLDNYKSKNDVIVYCQDEVNSCCKNYLNKISPFANTQYNYCYDFSVNDTESFVKYQCRQASIDDINTLEILSFIGIVLIIIFCFAFLVYLVRMMCFSKRQYEGF